MEGNILCTEFPSFPDSAELNSNAAPLRLFQDDVGQNSSLLSWLTGLSKVPCPMAWLC